MRSHDNGANPRACPDDIGAGGDPYIEFLAGKAILAPPDGLAEVPPLNPRLFPHQRDGVAFALRLGRAALFYDTGLGKTGMQLEWARCVHEATGRDVLILAPLAVAAQTVREGLAFGIAVTRCREAADVRPGVNVTNYDRLDKFDPARFAGVVLDESGILKSFTGTTRKALCEAFGSTPFRLCCTATPAPNDHVELGNHAEFLGVMPANEMLMRWFVNDTAEASQSWSMKRHGVESFWDWVGSWARCVSRPSDLGHPDHGFELPPLRTTRHVVASDLTIDSGDTLFRMTATSATGLHKEKRISVSGRAAEVASIVRAEPGEPWLIWCDTDYEADALKAAIPEAVEVRGSQPAERKEELIAAFVEGSARVLISKPRITGYGLNFQHCARMVFAGVSYSYEQYYQAVRRCWRFGQGREVHAHLVMTDAEEVAWSSVARKADDHERMKREMLAATRRSASAAAESKVPYRPTTDGRLPMMDGRRVKVLADAHGEGWSTYHADCVDFLRQVPDGSVDFSIYSPPFGDLFVYSDSAADMGNSSCDGEFMEHYGFLARELFRVVKPGRLVAVHCSDLPMRKWIEGEIALKPFSDELSAAHRAAGWLLHCRVTVWRDPVVEMQRTKALGLLYKQIKKDSSMSRTGMADYVLVFRKPGKNAAPIEHRPADFPVELWQKWASPVWTGIDQTNVLNGRIARDDKDSKHVCPLQLDLIERAVTLWSNPGDVVLSPFMGIGSEGVVSLRAGRRFVGTELKRSYFDVARRFLAEEERDAASGDLLDMMGGGRGSANG